MLGAFPVPGAMTYQSIDRKMDARLAHQFSPPIRKSSCVECKSAWGSPFISVGTYTNGSFCRNRLTFVFIWHLCCCCCCCLLAMVDQPLGRWWSMLPYTIVTLSFHSIAGFCQYGIPHQSLFASGAKRQIAKVVLLNKNIMDWPAVSPELETKLRFHVPNQ